MAMDKFRAAPLPNPPADWDPQYMRQVIRVLEVYFSQLDSNAPNHAQTYTADYFYGDGTGIYVPYNQFYSLVDQSAAAIDQAYAVQLEESSFTNGISITGANNTRITFSEPGIYTLNYSLSFANSTNAPQDIDIWFRYNNGTTTTDVTDSNSKFTIPARKSANVWVEIMWAITDTGVTMEYLPAQSYSAGVSPAHPATPSAIVQANFVSKAV